MSWLPDRRVVVTRSVEQADALAELLAARGATPVVVPLIEVVARPEEVQQLRALDPRQFDWIVVSSPNGAEALLDAHSVESLASVRLAAVGGTTRRRLPHCELAPSSQGADGVVAEFAAAPASVGQLRILVVQAVDAEPTLVDGLAALGHDVTSVRPYRAEPVRPSAAARADALGADAVTFASGSAARAWVEVFGTDTPPVVAAIGPQTATAAQTAGLKVTVVAADHSLAGIVAALDALAPAAN